MTTMTEFERVAAELVDLIREHPDREDREIIFQFFSQHLDYLDLPLIDALVKIFRSSLSTELANLYLQLGDRFGDFSFGNQVNIIEISIGCYQLVLEVYTSENAPLDWATTQNNLANAYCKRIRGDRAENVEQSIAYCQAALEVRTKADLPLDWATTQNNLANAYCKRIRGNRAENLEQSISYCQAALEIRTQADLPLDWAATQNNLGNAYCIRIRGDRAENVEQSIASYQAALEIRTQADLPLDWATTQHNLGNAYFNRIRGERAENLEQSIACCQAALEVRTQADLPLDWAATQNNLGNAYCMRIRGEYAENLERAIASYQAALEVRTQADLPLDWAATNNNLATAYRERIRGGRAENLERSIACYQAATEVYTQANLPIVWAAIQDNLATAYKNRIRGDRAENLEQAIASYQAVLEVRTKADLPLDWAITQNNLANAYINRIRGDRAENLERAIAGYQAILEVRTQADLPLDWAATQFNLAVAYHDRIRGDLEENLERSIACYQAAMEVYTQADLPINWAMIQNNLAVAYRDRIRGDRAENLERAIACYQAALEIRTKADLPLDWAMTQDNLAVAYRDRIGGDRAENLEQSISYCQAAMEVYTQTDLPINWAMTQFNLANAYCDRIRGDRAENLEQSIACYQAALEVQTPQNLPIDCLQTARNLGNLHFNQGNWQEAIDAYLLAITAVEQSRTWATSDRSKQEIIEQAIEVYFNLVQSCINIQQYDKALEYAERSKSRNLVELLAIRDLYPKGDIPPDILSQLDNLRRQVLTEERCLNQRRDSGNFIDPRTSGSRTIANPNTPGIDPELERLVALKQDLDRLVSTHIQPLDPSFQLTQQVQSIGFATMQNALPNPQTALIAWYISSDRIHTFIITPHQDQPHLITSTPEKYTALDTLRKTYLDTYLTAKNNWRETLPNLLQQLAQILNLPEIITQLRQLIPDCNQLILIPHRILHLLPLHALPLNEAGDCLLDLFPQGVRYAPSIQLLNLAQQWQRPPLQHLFAVQNPTTDLKFADVEVPIICKQFQPHVEIVKRERADKAALSSEHLGRANCAHFSCHGRFNFENPLASALILSGGILSQTPTVTEEKSTRYWSTRDGGAIDLDKCLTLGDIFQLDLRQCRLVTLSACETGLTDYRSLGDEYIGLPSGFLYAGSSNVISSLWAVSDLSTTFLMIKFYENVKSTDSVAIALNQAQQWLRHITKAELLDWIAQLNLGYAQGLLVEGWTDIEIGSR
jgi:CHAT domain-containing protein